MRLNARQWWSIGKAVLAVAILGGVGWQFARQLQSPEEAPTVHAAPVHQSAAPKQQEADGFTPKAVRQTACR